MVIRKFDYDDDEGDDNVTLCRGCYRFRLSTSELDIIR